MGGEYPKGGDIPRVFAPLGDDIPRIFAPGGDIPMDIGPL
jgi:hypothetical protein